MRSTLISACLSMALTLMAAEMALRPFVPPGPPLPAILHIMEDNPRGTGSFRTPPNLDLTTRMGHRTIHIATNAFGLRMGPVTLAKPPGTWRVAFLGDSFTFGLWADDYPQCFVGQVDQALRPAAQVLNFGVGSYGQDDEELMLREEAWRFAPDVVVLAFFNGNDFRDTWLGLRKYVVKDDFADWDMAVLDARIPPQDNEPVLPLPPPPSRWERYAIGRLVARAVQRYREERAAVQVRDFTWHRSFLSYPYWCQQPYPEIAARARDLDLQVMARMQAACIRHGARFAVVTLPFQEQVYAARERGPGYDVRYPQKYVEDWCAARGVPYLDLLPAFRTWARAHSEALFVPGEAHFTNQGHALAGRLMIDWLRQSRLAGPPPR